MYIKQCKTTDQQITDKAIRRGSFGSVRQLIQRIEQFVAHYNQNCKPFMWTATAESILAKLQRLCTQISGTGPVTCIHMAHRLAIVLAKAR